MSILQRITPLRTVLEHLSRGRKLKRRLPNGMRFYVTPDSQLKYLLGQFDRDLTDLARDRVTPDSVVWDIGANCGVFAFSCDKARQVVAIEADPFLANLIQESAMMNGMAVTLVGAAASSGVGLAEFTIAARGRASNHLSHISGRVTGGGERSRLLVPTITLDGLLDRVLPPTLVKIDVEGAELEVLGGAKTLLSEVRPVLYLEVDAVSREEVERLMQDYDYRLDKGAELNWLCTPN